MAPLQAAVADDRRLREDAAGADADRQRHGGGDQLLGAVEVTGEVGPVGAVVDHLDLVVAEAAIAEQFGEAVELGPPGLEVAAVEVGDRHGVAATEGHRQAAEPAAELLQLDADADPLVEVARVADHVAGAQQHRPEHLGVVQVASDRLGPAASRNASSTLRNSQCAARSTSNRARSGARLVTERGEGGLRDDSPLGHRIDEPDGAELGDRRGRLHQRPVVTGAAGLPGGVEQHRQALAVTPMVQRGGDADRQVERHRRVRRIEEAGGLQATPVVDDRFVVGVGPLGVLGRIERQLDGRRRHHRAAAPGRRGAPARTGGGRRRRACRAPSPRGRAARGAGATGGRRSGGRGTGRGRTRTAPPGRGGARSGPPPRPPRATRARPAAARRAPRRAGRRRTPSRTSAARSSTARASSSSSASRRTSQTGSDPRSTFDVMCVTSSGLPPVSSTIAAACSSVAPTSSPTSLRSRPCRVSAGDGRRPLEVGDERRQVGVEVRLGVTGREEDQQRFPAGPPAELAHDVTRRRRRPVQVLHDEQQRGR